VSAAMTAVYVPITARRILRDRIGESEDTGIRWGGDVFCRVPLRTSEVTISADWQPNALRPNWETREALSQVSQSVISSHFSAMGAASELDEAAGRTGWWLTPRWRRARQWRPVRQGPW